MTLRSGRHKRETKYAAEKKIHKLDSGVPVCRVDNKTMAFKSSKFWEVTTCRACLKYKPKMWTYFPEVKK